MYALRPTLSGQAVSMKNKTSLLGRVERAVRYRTRTWIWGMDIHSKAWVDPTAWIDRTWPKGIHIEADAFIGYQAVILTHDFTRGVYLDTTLGERCLIGARAIVMPGVSIGADAVVAPGSVVTRDVPAGGHVAGNPARPMTV
jgi:acetyltransferase-like isoleucine patch superfamily enzyme